MLQTAGRAVVLSAIVGSIACSSSRSVDEPATDAGVTNAVSKAKATVAWKVGDRAADRFSAVQRIVQKNRALDAKLAPNVHGLKPSLENAYPGFASSSFRAPDPHDWSDMGALFPLNATGSIRVGPARVEKWSAHLRPLDARDVNAEENDGRVLYADAWTHADLVAASGDRWTELFVLLRDAEAPSSYRFALTLGDELKLRSQRLPNGAIDLVDLAGDAALRISPAFLLDANGVRREVKLDVEDGVLSLEADTSGLAFPVVIDPLISVPVWQYKGSSVFGGRAHHGMAWDPALNKIAMFGGERYNSPYATNDTWSYDGTWAALTASSLSIRGYISSATWDGKAVFIGGCTMGSNGMCVTGVALPDSGIFGSSWANFCGGTGPSCGFSPRFGAGVAALESHLVVYGGADRTASWADYNTMLDTYVLPKGATPPFTAASPTYKPNFRFAPAMAGAPEIDKALMFGGKGGTDLELRGDTWLWNPTNATSGQWECVCGCTYDGSKIDVAPCYPSPQARSQAAVAWDSNRKRFVLYGGFSVFGDVMDAVSDTWEFDPATKKWTQLCVTCDAETAIGGKLLAGYGSAMAYDPVRRRMVMTAGAYPPDSTWYELYIRGGDCTTDAQCNTSHCVNNSCCEVASCAICKTCGDPANPGQCANVASGQPDPLGRCPACDGTGVCKKALGTGCAGATECASGFCTNGSCCDANACGSGFSCANASGTCKKITGVSCSTVAECSSGFCQDGVCCATACASNQKCNGAVGAGTCKLVAGEACPSGASQCVSNYCVDGYCCESACNGKCQACDVSGSLGRCLPVLGSPHGTRGACAGSGTACGATCDGSNAAACAFPGATTSCGSASCAAEIETGLGTCDGAGGCALAPKSCGAYKCGATTCKTTCATTADCSGTSFCKDGACITPQVLGEKCDAAAQCKSGNCVDAVCCGVASCPSGTACAVGPGARAGTCLKAKGETCTTTDECASSRCVDGVCCDAACNGQCEACNVTGSAGTCTPVVGKPTGTRDACDAIAETDCTKKSCDGVVRDKCNGFANGASTTCGADACTMDKKFQKRGTCDGKGTCAYPDPKPCTPYICDATATNGCKTTCAADGDCTDGFTCKAGACVQGASCNADRSASIDKAGVESACTPYRCGSDGTCQKQCATSDDCAAGAACDSNLKACVGAAAPVEDGGGCALGGTPNRTNGGLGAFVALAGLVAAGIRRRQSRPGA